MKRVAIVGGGIAGMSSAWFLRNACAITLYDKNDYMGGHTNTVTVDENGKHVPIDTGFMVFNDKTYPNLIRFFDLLGIRNDVNTDMSFGVQVVNENLEYACSNADSFFAQRWRAVTYCHWKLFSEIRRFFAEAEALIKQPEDSAYTLGKFVSEKNFKKSLVNSFLLPMTAAIWSTPPGAMLDFPAATLLRFMKNHGLLGIGTQFQWKTLKGGSRTYRDKIYADVGDYVNLSAQVKSVRAINDSVEVITSSGYSERFDAVIIAAHADEALSMLAQPTDEQKKLLSAFTYNKNKVVLHSDESVMPKSKKAWASWNYRTSSKTDRESVASTHYWMNSLQPLNTDKNYFVSVDYEGELKNVHREFLYTHPRFTTDAIKAQSELPNLNKNSNILFCGSYFKNGFHEDALTAGLDAVKAFTGKEAWAL